MTFVYPPRRADLLARLAIYAQISPNIKPFSGEAGTFGIACSEIDSLPAEISFTFTAQDGSPFELTIPSSELSVGPFRSEPSLCQTLINAADVGSIIGASLLKHYYSVWDLGNKRMGFAPNGESLRGRSSATARAELVSCRSLNWILFVFGLWINAL